MKMTKFTILVLLLLMCSIGIMAAVKVIPLPTLSEPFVIKVDDSQLYLSHGTSITIMSLKDWSIKKTFGQSGHGPKDFAEFVYARPVENYLVITSFEKLSYYSKNGELIKEMRTGLTSTYDICPIGKNSVSRGPASQIDNKLYITIKLYGPDSKELKELQRVKDNFQNDEGLNVLGRPIFYDVYDNKIWVAGKEDLILDAYDENGTKLFEINHKYARLKVTDRDKKRVMDFLKTDPTTRGRYESFFKRVVYFPDYFPALHRFVCGDGKIWVLTYKRAEESEGDDFWQSEFLVFDTNGKYVETVNLPIYYSSPIFAGLFAIDHGKLFMLRENLDTEQWELHVSDIKK